MVRFGKAARDAEWGFTDASQPRFHAGNDTGVLIVHGFGCTPSTMECLFDTAVSMGFTAVMPLLSGHAKTFGALDKAGFSDWRSDVAAAYERLAASGVKKTVLCGLSLGALLSADLAAARSDDPMLAGVFLICPPVRMKGYLDFCAAIAPAIPYVQVGEGFTPGVNEMYFGMATRKLNDIKAASRAVMKAAEKIKVPVTLVEAENDSRVDPVSYKLLAEKLPQAERVMINGAPHGIPYSGKKDELCRIFEDFLKKRV